MDRQDRGHLRKRVNFVAKDADEQVATGIVMVPDKVDLQGDFVRSEVIESFADQFGTFAEAGEAGGGVMHAVWPGEHMELAANGIVGGDLKTFPDDAPIPDDIETMSECIDWAETETDVDDPAAFCQFHNVEEDAVEGAWLQSWRFNDGELWSLVEDGVIDGYSIGAIDVEWRGPMEQTAMPDDVALPEQFNEDDPVWEITDGLIREVSAVDIPAVPDARILAKDEAEKRLADHLGNRDGFMEEAQQRGHSESEAERLWDYLSRAAEMEGADSPGEKGLLARAGKAFLDTLTGTDDATSDGGRAHGDAEASVGTGTRKEGRTLSAQNRDDLKAVVDAAASIMEDAGVDHGIQRFTDREEDAFDLTEHSARAIDTSDDEDDEDEDEDTSTEGSADTTDNDNGTTMTDTDTDSDPWDDAPEWAKSLRDDVESHGEEIAELKDADGDGGDDDPWDDAPEWASELKDGVESNAAAIETIGKQSGMSDQLDGGEETAGKEADEVESFKAGLMGRAPAEGD